MDKNRMTQSVIVGLAAVMAAACWAGLKSFLFGGGNWIFPSVGFLILLIFLSLNCLLTKSKINLFITLAFVLVSFFFSFGINLTYLVVLLAALLLFSFGFARAMNEKENRIKIQIGKILLRGLPSVLTGLALIIATVYYFSPLATQGQGKIEIPRSLFNAISQSMVDSDVIYEAANKSINNYSQNYEQYIPFGLAIGVFFGVKALGIVLMWLVIFLSAAIFKFLVASGAVKIHEKAVLQEVMET